MWLTRVLVAVLIGAIALVAAVPLFVLLDLVGGGDGWGICPDGLASCGTSYFQGPELAFVLLAILFGLLAVLRVIVLIDRWARRHRERQAGRTAIR